MALSTINRSKDFHVLYLRAPTELIDRIDDFARSENITVRQKAIFRLIDFALRQVQEESNNEFEHVG